MAPACPKASSLDRTRRNVRSASTARQIISVGPESPRLLTARPRSLAWSARSLSPTVVLRGTTTRHRPPSLRACHHRPRRVAEQPRCRVAPVRVQVQPQVALQRRMPRWPPARTRLVHRRPARRRVQIAGLPTQIQLCARGVVDAPTVAVPVAIACLPRWPRTWARSAVFRATEGTCSGSLPSAARSRV